MPITGQIQHASVVSWEWKTCWYLVLMNNNLIAWRCNWRLRSANTEVLFTQDDGSFVSLPERLDLLPALLSLFSLIVPSLMTTGFICESDTCYMDYMHANTCSTEAMLEKQKPALKLAHQLYLLHLWPGRPSAGYNVPALHKLIHSSDLFMMVFLRWQYINFSLKRTE